jgi:hypothetical protein
MRYLRAIERSRSVEILPEFGVFLEDPLEVEN